MCFFFQAEDGIRDLYVTGVQTCALPIFLGVPERGDLRLAERRPRDHVEVDLHGLGAGDRLGRHDTHGLGGVREHELRSEERRVGKEWRSRWAPELETEKSVMVV